MTPILPAFTLNALLSLFVLANSNAQAQTGNCMWLCDPSFMTTATLLDVMAEIDRGADVTARDAEGFMALHMAVVTVNAEDMVILLMAGADGSVKTENGKTAFDLTKDNDSLKNTNAYWMLYQANVKK